MPRAGGNDDRKVQGLHHSRPLGSSEFAMLRPAITSPPIGTVHIPGPVVLLELLQEEAIILNEIRKSCYGLAAFEEAHKQRKQLQSMQCAGILIVCPSLYAKRCIEILDCKVGSSPANAERFGKRHIFDDLGRFAVAALQHSLIQRHDGQSTMHPLS